MLGVTACALGWVLASPVVAPVPQPPPPDPLARGYLGISVPTTGLTVSTVEPNTPAARAGLRPGDRLLRVGSLEPQSFDQVIAHICGYRPGAVVDVEVDRSGEKKVFKVRLAVRDAAVDAQSPRPIPPFPDD